MDLDAFIESLMKTEKPAKFPHSMYYTEGTKYLNLLQYERALEFLDEAVKNDPVNVKSLLKRSKCLIALREYKKAIEDADRVLVLYPDNVKAIDVKGKAQYLMGDFEGGYMTYLEGRKMKPVNDDLRLGKQLCKEALDNSVRPSLEIKLDKTDVATIVKTSRDDKKFQNLLKYRRSSRDCFENDRKFMEDLMADKNLTSIHNYCEETVDYIKDCERFWAMIIPVHTRKKIPKVVKKEVKKPLVAARQIYFCKAAKRRAEYELKKGRFDDCIAETDKMMNVVETLPKEREIEKMALKCDALHLMSLAYSAVGSISLAHQNLLKELEIANKYSLRIPQLRTHHRLGESFQRHGNISAAIHCLNRMVAMDPKEMQKSTTSIEEIEQLKLANAWGENIVTGLMKSVRETIISPVVDTLSEYAVEMLSGSAPNRTENSRNNLV